MTNKEAIRNITSYVYMASSLMPEQVIKALAMANKALESIDQIKAERDAAVEDLSINGRYCVTCKYFSVSCKRNNKCLSDENEYWEWRGVQR